MSFYAVKKGKIPGIYKTWTECKNNIYKFSGAIYKKFNSLEEATEFIDNSINKNQIVNDNFNFNDCINIYTDGGCINNGKKNAKGAIGIFFSEDDPRNVSKKLISNGVNKITNNRAELKAILVALGIVTDDIKNNKIVVIHTDSEYSIKAFTTDFTLKRSENEIPNIDYIKKGYKIINKYKNIKFHHIRAHTGKKDIHSIGNDNADQLATYALNTL